MDETIDKSLIDKDECPQLADFNRPRRQLFFSEEF
jgi:hypothetical protein